MPNPNTPEFWDKEFAKEYYVFTGRKSGYWRWMPQRFERIAREIPLDSFVLDVGCGLGHFCRYLHARKPFGYQVFGTDFSEYALRQASEYDRLTTYFHSDAYSFSGREYDVVVAQEIIEHLDDAKRFLAEIKKAVKPDGVVIVTTPERKSDTPGSNDHVKEYTAEELTELMAEICSEGKVYPHEPETEEHTMIFIGRAEG